jgi:hypothetical protein
MRNLIDFRILKISPCGRNDKAVVFFKALYLRIEVI